LLQSIAALQRAMEIVAGRMWHVHTGFGCAALTIVLS